MGGRQQVILPFTRKSVLPFPKWVVKSHCHCPRQGWSTRCLLKETHAHPRSGPQAGGQRKQPGENSGKPVLG